MSRVVSPIAGRQLDRIGRPHTLRDYSLIADGERGALVGPHGDIVWMCFPHWHDPALFSALIGGGGAYAVTPTGRYVWGGYYEPGSLIWHSRWVTEQNAIIECHEALAMPATATSATILRRIVMVKGEATVDVTLNPRSDFGAHGTRGFRLNDGAWSGSLGDFSVRWDGGEDARVVADGRRGRMLHETISLSEGQTHDLVLALQTGSQPDGGHAAGTERGPDDAERLWSETRAHWDEHVPALENTVGTRDARHAYAVLRGMTSRNGGMVAAATMSLPERADQGRNFDYRYVWIRDQCYAGQAVAACGPHPLLDDAVRFVRERLLDDGPNLAPAYTTSGGRVPDEQTLDISGYPGGTDRVGNWVNNQFQLDAFGEALLLFGAAARLERLDADDWRAAEIAAKAIAARWQEPDAGIWELESKHWAHSKLACAAGLRAVSRHGTGKQAAQWSALADELVSHVATDCVHPSGRWQRAPDDERVDAALLLPGLNGALATNDPRTLVTLRAVAEELTDDGYAYRYRVDHRPLGEAEGAFLICGFWLSLAYSQQGERLNAARWFERSRSACGSPGLFSEEFDVDQRQLRGNLPQAFVHALLLQCAADQYQWGDGRGER